jgi:hypothetical protein
VFAIVAPDRWRPKVMPYDRTQEVSAAWVWLADVRRLLNKLKRDKPGGNPSHAIFPTALPCPRFGSRQFPIRRGKRIPVHKCNATQRLACSRTNNIEKWPIEVFGIIGSFEEFSFLVSLGIAKKSLKSRLNPIGLRCLERTSAADQVTPNKFL